MVVDDERALRETIAYNLRRAGMDVCVAADGADALELARAQRPSLILLDVLLPGGRDGFELCRLLRREHTCPIIFVTALADEIDRVVGLEVGADDYVVKPFSMAELVARVRARLRRVELWAAPPPAKEAPVVPSAPTRVAVGDIALDAGRREVHVRGKSVHLKRREFDLLMYLARHAGMILSRGRLLNAVWGDALSGKHDSRTVDVHIRRLREKIERHPSKPHYLVTVRGFGYVLRSESAPPA
jgi:DNA-binding response OmpR family regulator